ncbi:MAG: hypothetical protein ACYCYK_05020 [Candidatus Dormibacteria bacterium]
MAFPPDGRGRQLTTSTVHLSYGIDQVVGPFPFLEFVLDEVGLA